MITLNNNNVASRFNPVIIEPYFNVNRCRYNLRYDEIRDKFTDKNISAAVVISIVQRIRDLQIYDYPEQT